jgi:ketosteroid isomerase-like protein
VSNREIIERWYAERDTSLLADDIRWSVLPTFPEGGDYVGRAAVIDGFFPKLLARFDSYAAQPERFLSDGDIVVVLGRYQAKAKNGAVSTSAFAHVWTVRDGKIAAFDQIADTAAIHYALAA